MESLLRFHYVPPEQVFIGSSEIRSIDDEYRATYVGYRDEVQRMLDDIIVAGADRGDFTTDSRRSGRAIATMCVGVPPGTATTVS